MDAHQSYYTGLSFRCAIEETGLEWGLESCCTSVWQIDRILSTISFKEGLYQNINIFCIESMMQTLERNYKITPRDIAIEGIHFNLG